MNCHEHKESKTLIFWGQKCGATCLKEVILHIETESFFDNGGRDHITHNIYEKFYKQQPNFNDSEKYTDYTVLFFGRNPYERIVSLFLDKYVAVDSPTPETNEGACDFKTFINFLCTQTFTAHDSSKRIFSGFFPITSTKAFELFQTLTKANYSSAKIIMLDQFLLPDGKLLYNSEKLANIYMATNNMRLYDQIKHKLESNWTSKQERFNILKQKKSFQMFEDLSEAPIQELRALLKNHIISTESFFSKEVKTQFTNLYQKEINFFNVIS